MCLCLIMLVVHGHGRGKCFGTYLVVKLCALCVISLQYLCMQHLRLFAKSR